MRMEEERSLDLSVIMPCLNEEHTVGICIDEAMVFMKRSGICGEVLVVDNHSEDDSSNIARMHGARVETEMRRGYGNAIRTGIAKSRGDVLIIGDCDTTYDFLHLENLYQLLSENKCDVVIGDRFAGDMEPGSMSWLHQWGGRWLSFLGRFCFQVNIKDFHCGLRGMTRQAAEQMEVHTEGMEFATEMIGEAKKCGLRIGQVPVLLRKCTYPRKSKLRTIRDGMRHFIYIIHNIRKRGRIL